jgi:DNA replication and repair protein RecF
MFLQKIQVSNYKNYAQLDIEFSSKINCFVGDNGSGKTNLLDAIYYLSYCKSYFNGIDSQNIFHDLGFFAIHGNYVSLTDQSSDFISCVLKRNERKVVKINKKEYQKLSDHIGKIPLVMVSPYDVDLINEGSEFRRKYFDSVLAQFDKLYLDDLVQYQKILLQRNALLKSFAENKRFDPNALVIWDDQMVNVGERIHQKRKQFLNEFQPIIQKYFNLISGGAEQISVKYESQLTNNDFYILLKKALDNDRNAQYSTVGIHKDDYFFLMDDYPLKRFGSQGQQKTFLVALKLAQFESTMQIKKVKPILLLDDIFDKLDDNRVGLLINLVGNDTFGQVFISDTQSERISLIFNEFSIDHSIFQIKNAAIIPLNQSSDER